MILNITIFRITKSITFFKELSQSFGMSLSIALRLLLTVIQIALK